MKVCNLASGSKGNSTYIKAEQTQILIDSGLTLFEMEERLKKIGVNPDDISAILITHEHSDHILSVGRFAHAHGCKIYIHSDVWTNKRKKFEAIDEKDVVLFYDMDFYINEITVSPIALPHDSEHCVGFSIYSGGRKFSYLTDLGRFEQRILEHVAKSSLVLIESNHDVQKLINGPYPPFLKQRIASSHGHLSNDDCANAVVQIAETGTRYFILGHLSEENNSEELAFNCTADALKHFGGVNFNIEIASQNYAGHIYDMKGNL